MANANAELLARELVRLLGDLRELHAEMAMHMRGKLDAIRQADTHRIQSINARELVLARRAAERDGLRRQLTRKILRELGLAEDRDHPMRLRELAEHFAEPRRSQLLVAAAGLRETVEELERMRVTTELVTNEMLKHLQEVVTVMTNGGMPSESYSRSGRREQARSASVFEAVG